MTTKVELRRALLLEGIYLGPSRPRSPKPEQQVRLVFRMPQEPSKKHVLDDIRVVGLPSVVSSGFCGSRLAPYM